jgi:hypothetical protein
MIQEIKSLYHKSFKKLTTTTTKRINSIQNIKELIENNKITY